MQISDTVPNPGYYWVQELDNFTDITWPNNTNSCDDYYVTMRNVTKGFCEAFNRQAGHTWTTIPTRVGGLGAGAVDYGSACTFGCSNCFNSATLIGQDTFCSKDAISPRYNVMAVLIAR